MTLDFVFQLLEKGFTTFVAVLAVLIFLGGLWAIKKAMPTISEYIKEFIGIWKEFVKAMNANAVAIDKNTEITDVNYKQSEAVLRELKIFSDKFNQHDFNALEIRKKIDEVVELLEKNNNSDEVIELLQSIIKKLEQ